jgi:hypothetical protein
MSDTPNKSNTPEALAPAASPLAEASPDSINELLGARINVLFNTPPLHIDDSALADMVRYYQADRVKHMEEEKKKIAEGPKTRRKAPTSVVEALSSSADLV